MRACVYVFHINAKVGILPIISFARIGVDPANKMSLLPLHSCNLFKRCVLSYCNEECIYHAVRVSFATLARKPAVVKPSIHQHFPDCWISPVVCLLLRKNLDPEIIVVAS